MHHITPMKTCFVLVLLLFAFILTGCTTTEDVAQDVCTRFFDVQDDESLYEKAISDSLQETVYVSFDSENALLMATTCMKFVRLRHEMRHNPSVKESSYALRKARERIHFYTGIIIRTDERLAVEAISPYL